MTRIVLGTRGSALALWQARHVAQRLQQAHPGLEIVEQVIRTAGDERTDRPIEAVGEQGVFVRRIERALLEGEIDLAVHSMKDLPTEQPEGLVIAAVPRRHDPRDALVTREGLDLSGLPQGARIGTGSPRRRAQLLHARPDLEITPLRGNVDTRIGHVAEGRLDGVVLALAGIERLGLDAVPVRPLPTTTCVPAAGQGALALETRHDDATTREIVAALHDRGAALRVEAERAFLRRLGAGCLAPATAHADGVDRGMRVVAVVGELDGSALLLETEIGDAERAETIGARLAERLLSAGAERILEHARDPDV